MTLLIWLTRIALLNIAFLNHSLSAIIKLYNASCNKQKGQVIGVFFLSFEKLRVQANIIVYTQSDRLRSRKERHHEENLRGLDKELEKLEKQCGAGGGLDTVTCSHIKIHDVIVTEYFHAMNCIVSVTPD